MRSRGARSLAHRRRGRRPGPPGRISLDLTTAPQQEPTPQTQKEPADELARFGLTEREVLLLAAGRSNPEIAQALFISAKAASVHVSNILASWVSAAGWKPRSRRTASASCRKPGLTAAARSRFRCCSKRC